MITYSGTSNNAAYRFEFTGKSTDTKPTDEYDGVKILNGSTFLEMDTKKVLFYDAEAEEWV